MVQYPLYMKLGYIKICKLSHQLWYKNAPEMDSLWKSTMRLTEKSLVAKLHFALSINIQNCFHKTQKDSMRNIYYCTISLLPSPSNPVYPGGFFFPFGSEVKSSKSKIPLGVCYQTGTQRQSDKNK